MEGASGGSPEVGLQSFIDMDKGFQYFVMLALAGENASGLLDGAKFLLAAGAYFAFEVHTVGSEETRIVFEVGFAIVAEIH